MKPEAILAQALEHPRGIKLESPDIEKLRQSLSRAARKLDLRVSLLVPADAPNQLWVIPKHEENGSAGE